MEMASRVPDGCLNQSAIETKISATHSPGKLGVQVNSDLINQSLEWNYL